VARVNAVASEIIALFQDDEIMPAVARTVKERKTLLIEGGGQSFIPSRATLRRQHVNAVADKAFA
jgi:hypothetical protein